MHRRNQKNRDSFRVRLGGDRSIGFMNCRPACGACCIALSISSPIPGMPEGKPAGVRCVQLTDELQCALFGTKARPKICSNLRPTDDLCGASRSDALIKIAWLEQNTRPERSE